VLTALAARLGGTLAILSKIAGIMLGAATPIAVLATLATGCSGALWIVGEIATAVLAACVAGARCLFAILGEIARIAGMSLLCHDCSFPCFMKDATDCCLRR
jgi:hypothetical protein